jgi:hypothetical protein
LNLKLIQSKKLIFFSTNKIGLGDTWGANTTAQTPIEREIGSHLLQVEDLYL